MSLYAVFGIMIPMNSLAILGIYLFAVNVLAFALMGIDKRKAVRGAFRIPEATFFLYAIVGGVPGVLLGMLVFSHKKRKWKFRIGMPLILLFQLLLCLLIMQVVQEVRFY